MQKPFVRFDWAMKKLLRSKTNFAILEGFLSELLTTGQDIKIVRLLESESNKEDKFSKFNRVDMLAELDSGELVLIEVQVNSEADFLQRILFGTSKIVTEYIDSGDTYKKVKKVYSVNILYFDLGQGEDYIYHGVTSFEGIHKHDQLQLNDKQKQLYQKQYVNEIYPEYYLIKVNNFDNLAKNSLDEWIYFLKNEDIQGNFEAKGLTEAKKKLEIMKLTPEERQSYEEYIKDLRYEASIIGGSFDEGMIEGKKIGVTEGIEKGATQKTLEIAKKMKALNIPIGAIQNATGLEQDEIEKL